MRKMIVAALGVLLLAAAVLADTTYRVEDDVRNQSGVVVSGATVTVYNADTTTPATLYSGIDTALGTKSNPVYTDSSGRYWFYALPGRYDIKVERTGVTTYTREDVIVGAAGGGGGGSDWPSIEDYGAGAGDTTDDTDEINAAVAAVSASGGGKILVPSGDFYVNKAGATSSTSQSGIILMDGVTLVGEPGARIIIPAQQGSTASPFPSCWAISADGAYGIGIEDLEIVFEDGQPSGATHQITGINLTSCGDARINNVTITGPEYAGIYVYSQHDEHENSGLSISGCNIRSTGIYGRGIIVQSVTGGGIISQNEIFDIGHSGILLDSCRGMVVSENPIREVDRDGIECLGGLNNTITANPVASFGRYGISAYKSGSSVPTGYTIGSNTLRGNNANGDSGIYISSAVSTTIDANTISTVNWDGVNVGASIGGIFCTQSSTDPLDDVVISDNVIRDIDPDYAGGLTRRPFAIQVRGSGGPIRGVVVSDNNITNSYGAVYMRATGARTYTAGTIRSVTVGVDTVGVSDTTAPTATNLAMAAVEDGTSGNVVINWSLTANEQSTSTARWQINSEGWNTESTSGLATNHSAQINTSVDAVQDDTVKVNVRLVDQVGNASAWLNVGSAVIDTIPADPSDVTAPTITPVGISYTVVGGVITLNCSATTNEAEGAIHQYRHRVNGGSWVNSAWTTSYSNIHTETLTTTRAPTDGDEFDVYMRAEDQSSNMSAWAPIDSVTVSLTDDTAPTITPATVSAYDNGTGGVNIYYSFSTNEGAVAGLRYSRNGGAFFQQGPSEYIYVTSHSGTLYTAFGPEDGDVYALEAWAEDETGNRSAWTALGSSTIQVAQAGDPTIASVTPNSGTFSNGVTITIIGQNFGTKVPAAPWFFDDFEDGQVGSNIGSPWITYTGGDGTTPTYSNDSPRSSGSQSSKQGPRDTCAMALDGFPYGDSGDEFYITGWWRGFDAAQASQSHSFKFMNLSSSTGFGNTGMRTGGACTGWYANVFEDNGAGGFNYISSPVSDYGVTSPFNRPWRRYEYHGSFTVDGFWNSYESLVRVTNQTGDFADLSESVDAINFTSYYGTSTGGQPSCVNDTAVAWWYWDEVYIDGTVARIEIGDSANWASCTHREIQIPVAWSNGNITATFRPGSFATDDVVYLYVVDADGTVSSASDAITVGGQASAVIPAANIAFSLVDDTGYEQILVADSRPGGTNIDADMTAQWRLKSGSTWSPPSEETWYSGSYTSEPYVYESTGIFADSTPDTLIARAKLKSAAGDTSSWYYSGDLIAYAASDQSIPSVTSASLTAYLDTGDAALQGLVTPSIASQAYIQHKINSGGSWTPSDTTQAQGWTALGDSQDPIDMAYNSGATPTAGDTVYFRYTLRSQIGTHMGSWASAPSWIQPGATSRTWLWTFASGSAFINGLASGDFDDHLYGQSVEGAVCSRWPTDADGNGYGEDTWNVYLYDGGALPWSPGNEGLFYIWYPGAVADSIAGKTVTEATLYMRPYNSSNDLTSTNEGVVVTAILDAAFDDWNIPGYTSWGFSWAYSDTTGSGTAWPTQTWSNDVTSYAALGSTTTVQVNVDNDPSGEPFSVDITSVVQAIADLVDPSYFKGFAISILNSDGSNILRIVTGDSGTITNNPALTITTED